MPLPDINPILKAADAFTASSAKTTADIQGYRDSQANLAVSIGENNEEAILNRGIVTRVKDLADLQTQNARIKAGSIFGTDLTLQGEVVSQAVDSINRAYADKKAATDAIEKNNSVSFMDNPLQYIVNQFKHNDLVDRYNIAETRESDATKYLTDITALSSASAKNQENFNASLTAAAIEAKTAEAAELAGAALNKARIDGIAYNVEAIKEAQSISVQDLSVKFQKLGAENAQQQLKLAMDNYALHKQEFDWKKREKADANLTDSYIIDRMNKGFQTLYGANAPDLTNNRLMAKQMLALLKTGGAVGKEAADAFMAGQSGVIAGTPSQLVDLLKSGVRPEFTSDQTSIKSLFEDVIDKINVDKAGRVIDKKVEAESIDVAARAKLDDMLREVKPGDPKNIFNIPTPLKIIQASPPIAALPLVQKVLLPTMQAANGDGKVFENASSVYSAAIAAIQSGKITVTEAADGYTALYQRGVELNLKSKNIQKFGLVPTEAMRSYKTSVEVDPTALWGGTKIIDNTSPAEVRRSMLITLGKKAVANTVFDPTGQLVPN